MLVVYVHTTFDDRKEIHVTIPKKPTAESKLQYKIIEFEMDLINTLMQPAQQPQF